MTGFTGPQMITRRPARCRSRCATTITLIPHESMNARSTSRNRCGSAGSRPSWSSSAGPAPRLQSARSWTARGMVPVAQSEHQVYKGKSGRFGRSPTRHVGNVTTITVHDLAGWDLMMENTKKAKAILEKHGAKNVRLLVPLSGMTLSGTVHSIFEADDLATLGKILDGVLRGPRHGCCDAKRGRILFLGDQRAHGPAAVIARSVLTEQTAPRLRSGRIASRPRSGNDVTRGSGPGPVEGNRRVCHNVSCACLSR